MAPQNTAAAVAIRLADGLKEAFENWLARAKRDSNARRSLRMLDRMDDRALRDIGLTRNDVNEAARYASASEATDALKKTIKGPRKTPRRAGEW